MYLSTAVPLQRVLQHTCACTVGLVRDEVGLLGAIKGSDPGQRRQLFGAGKLADSFRLCEDTTDPLALMLMCSGKYGGHRGEMKSEN